MLFTNTLLTDHFNKYTGNIQLMPAAVSFCSGVS